MQKYNPRSIEKKWQKFWEEKQLYRANHNAKEKYYSLVEFPYPSGDGLHVGHVRSYVAMDIISRKRRMEGKNVLYPIGWDAFGLPTENYAVKTGIHPAIVTKKNTDRFRKQLKSLGLSFDWSREINTTDPEYYKWTQWIFLQFFKHGLAYKANVPINWCPSCKIGLANEEVVDDTCERCGSKVTQKNKEQWMLRITAYAEKLLKGLEKVDFLPQIKEQQKNWIGKSEGVIINFEFQISNFESISNDLILKNVASKFKNSNSHSKFKIQNSKLYIPVFTTRPDTLFGTTYLVLAPEHPFVTSIVRRLNIPREAQPPNIDEIRRYVASAKKKTEQDRTATNKQKTGVELKGIKAINPATKEKIPVWVADYVLGGYGTGAIMAVPAHDKRDFEFAKKYKLPIKSVIRPCYKKSDTYQKYEEYIKLLQDISKKYKKKFIVSGGFATDIHVKRPVREHGDLDICVNYKEASWWQKQLEKKGFEYIPTKRKKPNKEYDTRYHVHLEKKVNNKKIVIEIYGIGFDKHGMIFDMEWGEKSKWHVHKKEILKTKLHGKNIQYLSPRAIEAIKFREDEKDNIDLSASGLRAWTDEGELINSDKFSGLDSQTARKKITEWLIKEKIGKRAVIYKLRDWVFSRQRYWGEPIPLIYCDTCRNKLTEISNFKFRISKKNQSSDFKIHSKIKNQNSKLQFSLGELLNPGWIAVPEKDLPVKLPHIRNFKPRDDGESPLASVETWTKTKCPKCGSTARRETDVMPNWAGSSWYYLAYTAPKISDFKLQISKQFQDSNTKRGRENPKHLSPSAKRLRSWLPVDWYNGGMEHTTLHLLYSRFWNLFLYDIGAVPVAEPYRKRTAHGMILGEGGAKMSKSKGNVVNPDDIVKRYGADVLRLYEMFMGPFNQAIAWDSYAIEGINRFLNKVWKTAQKLNIVKLNFTSELEKSRESTMGVKSSDIERLLHQTIKKVSEDIESMSFNTAVSAFMIFINECQKHDVIPIHIWKTFLIILAPFAPHITEELYQYLGRLTSFKDVRHPDRKTKTSIHLERWPVYDPKKIKEDTFPLIVQVNGKVRATISAPRGIGQKDAKALAQSNPNVKKFTAGSSIKKIIFIPDRLINFVV